MTDSQTKQIQQIQALLAERRKYEQWIAQLDARQSLTPVHVYAKVHGDYVSRLTEAQARLSAETGAVQALATELETALGAQERQIGTKRDERAEAELRASVGEFSEREWDKLRGKLDTAIAELSGERDGLQREMETLRALLTEASAPAAPTASTGPAAVEAQPVAALPASTASQDSTGTAAPKVSAAPAMRKSVETNAKPEAAAPPPAEKTGDVDELAFLRSVLGRTTPYTAPGGQAAVAGSPPPVVTEVPAPMPPPARASTAARPSGAAAAPAAAAPRASGAVSAPRASEERFAMPEPPLEIPGPEPVESEGSAGRPSGAFGAPTPRTSEAVRSLKCQECGTLNFPTEWYCERCGGELAAF